MTPRTIGPALSAAATILMLLTVPASAMHWIIYAPDEANYRYWLDEDSIVTKGSYTYVTYLLGAPNSSAPTTPDGERVGINCKTGRSVWVNKDGSEEPGPQFTEAAYLYRSICDRRK